MTPILVAIAAAATFGVGSVTTSSLDYLVKVHEMSTGSRVTATATQGAPATSLSLADFGIDTVVCIHTPGRVDRKTCEGTATQLPPLAAGAKAIRLPAPVRAYVAQEGAASIAVLLDLDAAKSPALAAEAQRTLQEYDAQMRLAKRCPPTGGELELWRAGPAYVAMVLTPVDGLLFVTPRVVREAVGLFSIDATENLYSEMAPQRAEAVYRFDPDTCPL